MPALIVKTPAHQIGEKTLIENFFEKILKVIFLFSFPFFYLHYIKKNMNNQVIIYEKFMN
jgi:hypothetical protein